MTGQKPALVNEGNMPEGQVAHDVVVDAIGHILAPSRDNFPQGHGAALANTYHCPGEIDVLDVGMHSSESALFILTCTRSLVFRVGGIEVVTDDEFQFARVPMVFLVEGAKAIADVDVLLRVEQVAAAEFH